MPLNHINLEILNRIPLDGIDTHIACSGCDALCCREGTIMSLTKSEIDFMQAAGTKFEEYPKTDKKPIARRILDIAMLRREKAGRKLLRLTSDCGHLEKDDETGRIICGAYYDDGRPKICSEFKMGSYACGMMQLSRVSRVLPRTGTDE